MTGSTQHARVVVIGAGIAGIASAHELCRAGITDVLLIDPCAPMSLTSARSGENFRALWPQPELAVLMRRSIELMETWASTHGVRMSRRGYVYATRTPSPDTFIENFERSYSSDATGELRVHRNASGAGYRRASDACGSPPAAGTDVLVGAGLVQRHFPGLDPTVSTLVHARHAGDVDSQHLARCMLDAARERGARTLLARVSGVEARHSGFRLHVTHGHETRRVECELLVNAAGPFARDVAAMLDVELPLMCIAQQKIAFEDTRASVPRDAPFTIDLDGQRLEWSRDEAAALAESEDTRWLLEPLPGGIHCRPEGGEAGRWVKLGWAFNRRESEPGWEAPLDDAFPEIVLRGAARLRPALAAYLAGLPRARSHYGGFYTKTRENWPIIGPMGRAGAFVVTGLSGYGTMAACAAGELVCAWIRGAPTPRYGHALSLARYEDHSLMERIHSSASSGEL